MGFSDVISLSVHVGRLISIPFGQKCSAILTNKSNTEGTPVINMFLFISLFFFFFFPLYHHISQSVSWSLGAWVLSRCFSAVWGPCSHPQGWGWTAQTAGREGRKRGQPCWLREAEVPLICTPAAHQPFFSLDLILLALVFLYHINLTIPQVLAFWIFFMTLLLKLFFHPCLPLYLLLSLCCFDNHLFCELHELKSELSLVIFCFLVNGFEQ